MRRSAFLPSITSSAILRTTLFGLLLLPSVAGAQTTLVFDRFAGANGTAITSHTPDTNTTAHPWVMYGSPTPTLQNGLLTVGAGGGHIQVAIDAGASDFQMAVDYHVGGGAGMGALAFRLVDTNNHWVLLTYTGQLQLYRKQAGTYTF